MSFFNYVLVLIIAATAPTLVMVSNGNHVSHVEINKGIYVYDDNQFKGVVIVQYIKKSYCNSNIGCPGNLCCMGHTDLNSYCVSCPTTCNTAADCGNGDCCNDGQCSSCNCWSRPENCNQNQCCLNGRCASKGQVGASCPPISNRDQTMCPCQNGLTCQRNPYDLVSPSVFICSNCTETCVNPEYCCKSGQCLKAPQRGEQCTETGCPCSNNLQCVVDTAQGNRTCQGDGEGTCATNADCSPSNCCSNGKCLRRPTLNELCKPATTTTVLTLTLGGENTRPQPANDCPCAKGTTCRTSLSLLLVDTADYTCKKTSFLGGIIG